MFLKQWHLQVRNGIVKTFQGHVNIFLRRNFCDQPDKCKKRKMVPKLAPTVKLSNGYEMPILGLGTYQLMKRRCETAVSDAIDIGYRHIDTAYLYRNETYIGNVLQRKIYQEKSVQREDLFIVTKLWDIFHEPAKVEYACRKQLESLSVDYFDLYLMHSPIGYKYVDDEALMPHEDEILQTNEIDYVDTYKAMEKLVDFGLVRSLGLSNFNSLQIQRIMDECSIKPVTLQIECHPGLNQRKLIDFCRQHNIVVTAYSPLARPKPSKPTPPVYLSPKVQNIAQKHNKTIPQIILRYLIDIGTVPIPKSAHYDRLFENFNIFDFHLTSQEISLMDEFDAGDRLWKFEKSKGEDCVKAVKAAIDVGYRHIDTAYFYQNEKEVGKAVREKIKEGVVKREDLFIVTKLWQIHHDPELVEKTCCMQNENLGLGYIDLYLIHMPVGYKYVNEETLIPMNKDGTLQLSDVDYIDTYKAMEKCVESGMVRSLGLSNFNSEQLQRVLDCSKIKPVTNQVEVTPLLNQKKLIKFCMDRNVKVTAYRPLGSPKPDKRTPAFYFSDKVQLIAEKYKKTPAQIILRYLIELCVVPIPKSSNPQRIAQNIDVFDFNLTPDEVEVMDCFNTGERLVPLNAVKKLKHKYYPFNIEY